MYWDVCITRFMHLDLNWIRFDLPRKPSGFFLTKTQKKHGANLLTKTNYFIKFN